MAQIRKMEVQTELKSSADNVYDIYRNKMELMPKVCPQVFKDGKLVEGDWINVGSARVWTYANAGKIEIGKQVVEAIDDESKTITYNIAYGDVLNYYKSFRPIVNIVATGQGSMVKWTVEYEKLNDSVPDPTMYNDFFVIWAKSVDAYLLNA